jgi:hypothetical protein
MIQLLDILKLQEIYLGSYKIHFASDPSGLSSPLSAFFEGKFQEWQDTQRGLNFQCDTILSLIKIDNDYWLFAGVYRPLSVEKIAESYYRYHTELLPNQNDLIGRVIVKFRRIFRNSYVWGHRYGDQLEIAEIRSERMSIREFPGYNKVIISYRELQLIINQNEPGWKSALSNVQGIYLITDNANGKNYVGSAYGIGGLWSLWENYALNCHGGNCELQNLIEENGKIYADNFQFSILEIADMHMGRDMISEREQYWKNALLSKRYGYNSN